jgi:hypothetical protein
MVLTNTPRGPGNAGTTKSDRKKLMAVCNSLTVLLFISDSPDGLLFVPAADDPNSLVGAAALADQSIGRIKGIF